MELYDSLGVVYELFNAKERGKEGEGSEVSVEGKKREGRGWTRRCITKNDKKRG